MKSKFYAFETHVTLSLSIVSHSLVKLSNNKFKKYCNHKNIVFHRNQHIWIIT